MRGARCGAVIFDCDGVLVDSEPQANRVLSEVLGEHGVRMTADECREMFAGLNPRGVGKRLLERRGVNLTGVLIDQAVPRFMALLRREGLTMVPGVLEVLESLRGGGVPVAVASNSPIEELRLKLELTGLRACFEPHVHSGDEIGRAKPEPDVYLAAAAGLGIEAASCVVIEDTVTGVSAGVRAGMRVLGFDGAHGAPGHRESLVEAGAVAAFSAMADLPGLLAG